ncbi:hypothetical protein G3485_22040 [Shewanella baltica]|uniref:hypothetical protein n=1 Tax=Shewanella baltica TaxID=62322 RepID=UPI0001E4DCA9|nr:hypothetical protein [Shewanella baltica]AEG13591.1 hypothetical protein Sbal175_4379 [Shewanella baltica BA175]MCS6129777.1 hypothetical protein [Shewanella baltica]MCS6141678.1 hypothetical protein [Shewanella baltica]MCS6148012.1 hypothetical protein [Shewanella baltica]MCS6172541.1 hypothetical protein [Shewanella baltica]
MHIDALIFAIKPHIPFVSEAAAQVFLTQYPDADQSAFITALYIGRSHLHFDELSPDYKSGLLSGEINRHWDDDTVPAKDRAKVLYEKNSNLTTYYDAFIRCTNNSKYNRDMF